MNIFKQSLLFLLFLGVATACDEVDDLTEFDANVTLNESINVDVAEGEDEQSFSQSITLDIAENDEVADNIDAIESVTITALSYSFQNVGGNPEAMITNAQLSIGGATIAIADVNPTSVEGQIFEVEGASQLNTIAAALENNTSITATVQGSIEDAPVNFVVEITLSATITIDAL